MFDFSLRLTGTVRRLHNGEAPATGRWLQLPASRAAVESPDLLRAHPFVPVRGLDHSVSSIADQFRKRHFQFTPHLSLPFASQSSRCEKSPLTGNAFKLIDTAILKMDSGARDQILHCSGNEHITRFSLRHNPCTDVDRDAADIVAH